MKLSNIFHLVSGEAPQEPYVSKKSGFVYEKRLIIKYIADSGKEPGTGEDLTEDDLLPLKLSKSCSFSLLRNIKS